MSIVSQTSRREGSNGRGLLAALRPIAADLGGTLAFYLVYLATGSARVGAVVGLALGVGQLLALTIRRRKAPPLLVMSVVLTVVLGGLTFAAQDPRFLLLKPSIVCACVGLAMLPRGWLAAYLPGVIREHAPAAVIDRAGWAWAGLMFATALLNVALLAALPPRLAAAGLTIWASASKLGLFAAQYRGLRRTVRRALARAA